MNYAETVDLLKREPRQWLVTGAAGFIGSHLVETLLRNGQWVRGLDNFTTGYRDNLQAVRVAVGEDAWKRFELFEADIRHLDSCRKACLGVEHVLHEAALGSVPLSVDDPLLANQSNVDGFLHMLVASRDSGVKSFVYAASSATYGDDELLPKREECIGKQLSPYAVTKYVNELYASVFTHTYGLKTIGLRYFNVFGPRQSPDGAYAAVIPLWFQALLRDTQVVINGDGQNTRDFCYIDNCVQANILASLADRDEAWDEVYNIAVGECVTLNELFGLIRYEAAVYNPAAANASFRHGDFRQGDIRYSVADISKARRLLEYEPIDTLKSGLRKAASWYASALMK